MAVPGPGRQCCAVGPDGSAEGGRGGGGEGGGTGGGGHGAEGAAFSGSVLVRAGAARSRGWERRSVLQDTQRAAARGGAAVPAGSASSLRRKGKAAVCCEGSLRAPCPPRSAGCAPMGERAGAELCLFAFLPVSSPAQ